MKFSIGKCSVIQEKQSWSYICNNWVENYHRCSVGSWGYSECFLGMIRLMLTNLGQKCWEKEERRTSLHSDKNPWFILLWSSMSYSYFLPSLILKKDVGGLENVYSRTRTIEDMEWLPSKNGLERAPSISGDTRRIEESECSPFFFQNKNDSVSN